MDKINNQTPLTSFKALSFDCYGTLINWEPSVTESLSPILTRLPADHAWRADPSKALQRLMHHSDELEKGQPTLLYNLNLAQSFEKTAKEAGVELPDLAAVAKQFGDETPGKWPAFADSVEGLKVLGKHYKLIILSNITRKSIDETTSGPLGEAKFDAVYTAEEIGSYKPAHQNFHYLFQHARDDLGIKWDQGDLLHVAHSVPHDHVPSKELGLRSAWISRGGGLDLDKGGKVLDGMFKEGKIGFEWHFDSIGEFAKEVERQFTQKG